MLFSPFSHSHGSSLNSFQYVGTQIGYYSLIPSWGSCHNNRDNTVSLVFQCIDSRLILLNSLKVFIGSLLSLLVLMIPKSCLEVFQAEVHQSLSGAFVFFFIFQIFGKSGALYLSLVVYWSEITVFSDPYHWFFWLNYLLTGFASSNG